MSLLLSLCVPLQNRLVLGRFVRIWKLNSRANAEKEDRVKRLVKVDRVIIHPQYSDAATVTESYDFAVLVLASTQTSNGFHDSVFKLLG